MHPYKVFKRTQATVTVPAEAELLLSLCYFPAAPTEQGFRAQDAEKDLEILSASQPAATEQDNLRPWSPNPPVMHPRSPA